MEIEDRLMLPKTNKILNFKGFIGFKGLIGLKGLIGIRYFQFPGFHIHKGFIFHTVIDEIPGSFMSGSYVYSIDRGFAFVIVSNTSLVSKQNRGVAQKEVSPFTID